MTTAMPTNLKSLKYLVTGGKGYLGSHICEFLTKERYTFSTLGLVTTNTYVCDLAENVPTFPEQFDVVVHCAGKAHSFPKTKKDAQVFFDVNVTGTKNLLKGLEKVGIPKYFVFMSSVSVYGKIEGEVIDEGMPLLSTYPYGLSKIKAEEIITAWCKENNVSCLILRLPLLAGKNPPGNLKAMINSIRNGLYLNIADGEANKSIVMANDVASVIPKAIAVGGVYNLTDGYHPSVKELASLIANQLNKDHPKSIPKNISKVIALLIKKFSFISPTNAYKFEKLMSTLTFDDSKARKALDWNPSKVLDNFKIK